MRRDHQVDLAISSRLVAMVIRSSDDSYVGLRSVLAGLERDELIDLIALAWIGRKDFTAPELEAARAAANVRHRHSPADYLLSTPRLGPLLATGERILAAHASTGVNVRGSSPVSPGRAAQLPPAHGWSEAVRGRLG